MCFFNGHINELGEVPSKKLKKLTKKILANPHLWNEEDKKKPISLIASKPHGILFFNTLSI